MNCPKCNTKIDDEAVVTKFLWEPNWAFWGIKGHRWIVCQTKDYVHFKIDVGGYTRHRLAQIKHD